MAKALRVPLSRPCCNRAHCRVRQGRYRRKRTHSGMIKSSLTGFARSSGWRGLRNAAAAVLLCAAMAGCGEQFQRGYILPPGALEQIPIGASQDQVLIVLGTPSTVATLDGEVFYYISQH